LERRLIRILNTHERVELPVESLMAIEALAARFRKDETEIEALYARWRAGGHAGYVNLVDTRSSEPMLFRLPHHNGRFSQHWPTRLLKDFPAPDHARMCAIEYAQCARLARPMAHYIRHAHNLMMREYFRLVVPLEGGRLAYATRALTGPNASSPPERD
jgi:hypothetical protein